MCYIPKFAENNVNKITWEHLHAKLFVRFTCSGCGNEGGMKVYD
jgi:hypothetical protein